MRYRALLAQNWVSPLLVSGLLTGIIGLALSGCGGDGTGGPAGGTNSQAVLELPTAGPTAAPTALNTRVLPTIDLTPRPSPTITPIPAEVRGLVVQVLDGDTVAIVLEGDSMNQTYEVRYIGVDAPPNSPSDPWGVVAYETNRRMTSRKVVRLVADQVDFDEDGRLLRHVFVGNQLMSVVLADQGLAEAAISDGNDAFEAEITAAESRSREGGLGIWSGVDPTATATRTQAAAEGEPAGTQTPEPDGTPADETAEPSPESESEGTGTPGSTASPSPEPDQTGTPSPTATETPPATATEEP